LRRRRLIAAADRHSRRDSNGDIAPGPERNGYSWRHGDRDRPRGSPAMTIRPHAGRDADGDDEPDRGDPGVAPWTPVPANEVAETCG
jgi:hypothetical protein